MNRDASHISTVSPAADTGTALETTWTKIESISSEWEQIAAQSEERNFFSSWQWSHCWWTVYGVNRRPYVLTVRGDNDEMVGIAPFYLTTRPTASPIGLRTLCLIGNNDDSGTLDILASPGSKQLAWRAILDFLETSSAWDILELNNLDSGSETIRILSEELASRALTWTTFQAPAFRISLPENWDVFLARLSPKLRRTLHREERKLNDRFSVAFRKCSTEAEIGGYLDRLSELHSRRWAARDIPGAFNEQRRDFYRRICENALRKGWLDFWELTVSGRVIASEFGFAYNHCRYALQSGFDPDFGQFAVGRILEAFLIKAAIERGDHTYDLMFGSQPYKVRWGATKNQTVNIRCAKPWSLGSIAIRTSRWFTNTAYR